MFEMFNEAARRALFFSRYEASLLGKVVIDSEHILLGVIREPDAVTDELFSIYGVDPARIRARYPAPDPDARISSSAELPLSEHAKKILAYSASEAERMGERFVGSHTLLLAILRVTESSAANLLNEFGMSWPDVAEVVDPLIRQAAELEEKNERTPIQLRSSHYEMLDVLAQRMRMPPTRRASRQELVLAIVDAVAASGIQEQPFASVSELRESLTKQLSARWPRA